MISLIATLIVLGIVFYLIELIPMEPVFHTVIRVVAILIAVILVLQALGIPLLGLHTSL